MLLTANLYIFCFCISANILNDLNCVITETTSPDFRLRTNVYIVLDSSWPYNTIYPAISYLLDTIEVNKFGSSVTLLSAFDGSELIPQTFSLANFHSLYTATAHQSCKYMFHIYSKEPLFNVKLSMSFKYLLSN